MRWQVCLGVGLLVAGHAAAALAQVPAENGSLSGVVVAAKSGEPLPGALIEIMETGARAVSGANGRFVITGLRDRAYTLRVDVLGRVTKTAQIESYEKRAGDVVIELAAEPVEIAALRVLLNRSQLIGNRGNLTRIPGSAHLLGAAELQATPGLLSDPLRILRQVPGVNVQEEEGYGLRPNIGLRGTGVERSSKIALMEDGVLVAPAPYAAPAAYYFPVTARMEAVEVRKGSSQVKYGPWTTGGAINLVSSSIPQSFSLEADLAGGGNATRRLQAKAGTSTDHIGFVVETYQIETDGFKQLDGGGQTGFEIKDYVAKIRVNTDPQSRFYQEIELKAGRTDQDGNETYLGLSATDFEATPLRRYAGSQRDQITADHEQFQLRYFARPTGSIDFTTTLYRNDFARNWYKLDAVGGKGLAAILDDPATNATEFAVLTGGNSVADALRVRANKRSYYSEGVQTVLGLEFLALNTNHAIEIGARLHRDAEDRFQHDDAYQMQDGIMVLTTAGAPGSNANRISAADALSIFLDDRVTLGAWTVTPGVRYEKISFRRTDWAGTDPTRSGAATVRENDVEVFVPGVGLSRVIGSSTSLFGGVHKGFGPPGPGAHADTRPEESINYELGARLDGSALRGQVALFYSDYENILGRETLAVGETGTGDEHNGGAVDVKGLEVSLEYDAATAIALPFRAPLRAAYTFTNAQFRSSFESEYDGWDQVRAGDELPYLPRHQASGSIAAETPRWSAILTTAYASAMRTVAGSGDIDPAHATDAYLVLSGSAEYQLLRGTKVYAGIQNITDNRYIVARRPAGARPGLPRMLLVGLRFAHN